MSTISVPSRSSVIIALLEVPFKNFQICFSNGIHDIRAIKHSKQYSLNFSLQALLSNLKRNTWNIKFIVANIIDKYTSDGCMFAVSSLISVNTFHNTKDCTIACGIVSNL